MCLYPLKTKYQPMYLPCGRCVECVINKSREWSYRIALEASLYEKNCFITLTYNDEHLPESGSVNKKHLQDFMKRLRFQLSQNGVKIRFFATGEYGSKFLRPHYHLAIFGWCPDDMYFFKYDNKKNPLFRSPLVEKCWKFGFSSVLNWDNDLSIYVAKYMQKRVPEKWQDIMLQPFVVMSNRPGIGAGALKDKWLDSDKIYINGKYNRLPRYFLDLFSKRFPDRVKKLKDRRFCNSVFHEKVYASLFYNGTFDDWQNSLKIYKDDIADRRKKILKKFGYTIDITKNIYYNKYKIDLEPYEYTEQMRIVCGKWISQSENPLPPPVLECCDIFDDDGVLIDNSPFTKEV